VIHALVDADIFVYRVGYATENEDETRAINTMAESLEDLLMVDLNVETWEIFITGKGNFRYDIAVTAPYKGNRKSEKPKHYHLLREYLEKAWDAHVATGIEADDAISIKATEMGTDSVIVTIDKDLNQVPGWHYNFVKKDLFFVTEEEGILSFYKQMLTGDDVDNIKGVRGIGPKKADKLLDAKSEKEMWDICVEHLGSEERAIENAHLLWMLRYQDERFVPPQELRT